MYYNHSKTHLTSFLSCSILSYHFWQGTGIQGLVCIFTSLGDSLDSVVPLECPLVRTLLLMLMLTTILLLLSPLCTSPSFKVSRPLADDEVKLEMAWGGVVDVIDVVDV